MKILVVSAHYPPNFVSGGTLAPQRQAQGLRAMGHEVSVYAGWLGHRPALQTWTSDDAGMSVRWVVTSPWIEYGDRNNYDNPAVEADFGRHLADVRPDIVHFHSLQTLGAGLLDAAAAGCKVVVTMHDFWWSCARQFFVTRELQPCCLVVSCARCPCGDGQLRLTYTGGQLRLKGVHVLFEATRRLDSVPGWHLTAYGAAPYVEQAGVDLDGLPVVLRPPFEPTEAEAVFAATDVLVVPSVMRESYSLVTREALTRGVPVVCTDSLGPRRWWSTVTTAWWFPRRTAPRWPAPSPDAREPWLLERLRAGCSDVRVRSMDD
jgi:glycosyltransferase involved in cell wall biosynthesis